MNRALIRDFFVGLTAILGVAGLVGMLLLFGEIRKRFEPLYPIRLAMPDASGIGGTSPVLFNGVRVGAIARLEVADPPSGGMIAHLNIRRGVKIPRDLAAYVEKGFVGDSALALSFAPDADRTRFIGETDFASPDAPPIPITPRTLFGDLQRPLEQLSSTAAKFEKFAETYTKVGENLQALLEPRTSAEVDAGKPPTIASVVARMDATLAGLQKWTGDEALFASIKDSSAKLGELVNEARSAARSIDEAAKGVQTTLDRGITTLDAKGERAVAAVESLSRDAKTTLTRLDGALTEMSEIATKINRGDGTAGQLVNNPDLYRSLNSAASRLDKALIDLQLLLQKFKAEGIKVGL